MMATLTLKRCRAPSADDHASISEAASADAVYASDGSDLMGRLSVSNESETNCDSPADVSNTNKNSNANADKTNKTNKTNTTNTDNVDTKREDEELDRKCRRLATLIGGSRHLVAFTGAGISTAVGLPDYRGDGGIRTKGFEKKKAPVVNANKRRRKAELDDLTANGDDESNAPSAAVVIPDFHSLVPSTTHMALQELHRLGYLKHVVSQNVDNLHLKSGIPADALTEVHGNATQAKCETCEKIYTTDFPITGLCNDPACVSTKRSVEQRLRARTRHGNGRLKRNVISFDEPMGDIDRAIDECEVADVALVLGTSLRVEPFTEMAGEYAESLIIVNLLPTVPKLDRRAETTGVRLYEKCDVVMEKVMKYLLGESYTIPAWSGDHPDSVFVPEHEEKNLVNVLAGRLLSS